MPWPTHALYSDRYLTKDQMSYIRSAIAEIGKTGEMPVFGPGLRLEPFPQNPHAIADGMLAAFSREG